MQWLSQSADSTKCLPSAVCNYMSGSIGAVIPPVQYATEVCRSRYARSTSIHTHVLVCLSRVSSFRVLSAHAGCSLFSACNICTTLRLERRSREGGAVAQGCR